MRIEARKNDGLNVQRVTLNGHDVTKVSRWCDSERGEVGVYGHTAQGTLIDVLENEPDIDFPKLELIPSPDVARIEDGLYVCRGKVEVTFRDVSDLAITE